MKLPYDIHVATDAGGNSTALRQELLRLGFTDDKLVHRGLTFNTSTGQHYTACPLIDIHVSKKTSSVVELRRLQAIVDSLLRNSGCSGYWHSEYTELDVTMVGSAGTTRRLPPFKPMNVRPRDQQKVWDLHVAMVSDNVSSWLSAVLLEHGMYSIKRIKPIGNVTVWTLQGVSGLAEGREFARRLLWWLCSIEAPDFDFKFEITLDMSLISGPALVPPTVKNIVWR